MIIPSVLALSLAAVLASSLLLIGPFSIDNILPAKNNNYTQGAEAVVLPLVVRDHFTAMEMAGDAEADSRFMTVNENFVDPENHCEFCTRVEYRPGPQGQAGFSYQDLKGLDLSGAKNVRFWVMGEEGGEKIKFKVAGKGIDKLQDKLGKLTDKLTKSIFKSERFALTTEEVTLDDDWKKYEVDLSGIDLKGITHPFAFELFKGNSAQKQVVYIKGVVYDEKPAEDPLTANAEELIGQPTANIISNGTEGVAPATFKLESNITGGKEPYLVSWNFDDGKESDAKTVSHIFREAGTYNVVLEVPTLMA
ncbi:MAG TPA: PKD domain-containing protein [Nitrososphaera sp.]|nr:PKD domain-containing protein [Nitrososphaera sp.]